MWLDDGFVSKMAYFYWYVSRIALRWGGDDSDVRGHDGDYD